MTEDRRGALALGALVQLLERVGEDRWAGWARGQLGRAAATGVIDADALEAYGGMGSFEDLILDPVNGHALEPMQVPWANQLLAVLGERVYRLAREGSDDHFEAGWARPGDPPLEGWRCLACGHAEVTTYDIEWWAARIFVPAHVGDAALAADPALVDRVLDGHLTGVPESRGDAMKRAWTSGLAVTEREGNMRPCPACGSGDTAVYRWVFLGGELLTPADDNLDVRGPDHAHRPSATAADLMRVLDAHGARRLSPGLWELPRLTHADLLDAQTATLEALRGLPASTYLAIHDDVSEEATSGGWRAAGQWTWTLPEHLSSRVLLQTVLEAGAWQMYVSRRPTPVEALPDAFRDRADIVRAKIGEHGIVALVESWPDNLEWRVLLSPDAERA